MVTAGLLHLDSARGFDTATLNGFYASRGKSAAACIEISGIEKRGDSGTLKETHFIGDGHGTVARYTVEGTVALGASLSRWGSNGTANFSSSKVILDAVIPRENRAQVKEKLASGQSRACQYLFRDDTQTLTLECNPPSAASYGFLGFDNWDQKSSKFPDTIVPWSYPVQLGKNAENCHFIASKEYKDVRYTAVPVPTTSSYCLRMTLSANLAALTDAKRAELVLAVANIGQLSRSESVKLDYAFAGSIVVQFKIESYKGDVKMEGLYKQWVALVDEAMGDTTKLCGFAVLAADFLYHEALQFEETTDKVPAWAALTLILASMFFLCWVGYTVQCRHMVLELERSSMPLVDERPNCHYRRMNAAKSVS